MEQCPLPLINDIFANLSGGEKFSKIDLRQAYLQMEMNEQSKQMLTINTHKGLSVQPIDVRDFFSTNNLAESYGSSTAWYSENAVHVG